MKICANIKKLLFFTSVLLLLVPDNGLLASDVNTPSIFSMEQKFSLESFMFLKNQDEAKFHPDSLLKYKERAIFAAKNDDVKMASENAQLYVQYSGETEFVNSGYFSRFKNTEEFQYLSQQYGLNFSWLNFFYLFTAIIGFYISIMLLLKRKQDKIASFLISLFLLIHSLFIFHIFLYITNLIYRVPHALYMSSIFSYLYGPLIYFYFKRITLNYKFRKIDLIHLVPTVLIIMIMLPIFMFPESEKLRVLLEVGSLDRQPYLIYITTTKFASLLFYGYLVLRVYLKSDHRSRLSNSSQKWIRNMVVLTEFYVLSYLVYGLTIMNTDMKSDFLFNFQIVAMASMVLYIGYSSYVRPNLFSKEFGKRKPKYKKSGLTPSFSNELKEQLLYLLEEEQIYRQNNINLEKISERLGTTRHNTSQVINEHFGLNFFELINKYRINEALEILKNDTNKNLNIIDVAYEVGFNNKVTFNKSFRKQLSLTPTQYLSSLNS
ncbi:MAG: helix-turn-helix domain-containing protein [Flavobacteriaceae bacterium]|nr:helix-turn-helix domain-containing protein [Flavobacteriaceae bacterium]